MRGASAKFPAHSRRILWTPVARVCSLHVHCMFTSHTLFCQLPPPPPSSLGGSSQKVYRLFNYPPLLAPDSFPTPCETKNWGPETVSLPKTVLFSLCQLNDTVNRPLEFVWEISRTLPEMLWYVGLRRFGEA